MVAVVLVITEAEMAVFSKLVLLMVRVCAVPVVLVTIKLPEVFPL